MPNDCQELAEAAKDMYLCYLDEIGDRQNIGDYYSWIPPAVSKRLKLALEKFKET